MKNIKILMALREDLLVQLDYICDKECSTRSELLRQMIRDYIKRWHQERAASKTPKRKAIADRQASEFFHNGQE